MQSLLVALAFLTRLPVPAAWLPPTSGWHALGRAAAWFPVAGAAAGACAALAAALAGHLLPPPAQAAAAVAAGVWVTGALHLDGLMDTADGLAAGGDRDRMLAAMRDSRVGAAGAVAGALALLVRFALVLSLPSTNRAPALVLAAATARWALVWAAARHPAARPGLGSAFAAALGPRALAGATAALALVAAALGSTFGPTRAAATVAAGALAGVLASRRLASRLGGLTGDTYGAVCELAELAALTAACAGGPGALPWG